MNKPFIFLMILAVSAGTFRSIGQSSGVAINATGLPADPSAMLDITSTDHGVLIPRVSLSSTSSSSPIAAPATSLLVYNEATAGDVTPGFYYWDGSAWVSMGGSGSSSPSPWTKTGSNIYQTVLSDYVGVGTATPDLTASLDITSTTRGFLMPRMTTVQRDAITTPAVGLQIYNLDCNGVNYWNGTCWLSTMDQLQHPGEITASATIFCSATTQTFSIAGVTGATNYVWTVPPGASISSGQGTTSISVAFGASSGQVCVTAFNACSSSPESCLTIEVTAAPSAPGAISGPTSAARGASPVTYSISPVSGATSYTWTVPSGASIISGAGTSSIVVDYPCSSTSGSVTVSTSGTCGSSAGSSAVAVTLGPVANAGTPIFATGAATIGGTTAFPTASGGTGSYTYSWTPAVNLNSYTGANPVPLCLGSTTTYTVLVTDGLGCTATSSVVVTRGNSVVANAGPNQTISGAGSVTIGGSPTASNATGPFTYSWTPSTGLSSTTVANPTASPGTTTTYTVTVNGSGSCPTSATSSTTVTVNSTQQTFNYTGNANVPFTVPNGVTSIKIEVWGAQGGGSTGGLGGYASVVRTVTPGDVFYVNVGGQGGAGSSQSSAVNYAALNTAGFNGGGAGAWKSSTIYSAGGGGASDVRFGGTALGNRIIVGGGGGGKASGPSPANNAAGGGGGFPAGAAGAGSAAGPGTQTEGGTTGGSLGIGANGVAAGSQSFANGAGGGGYYGGGYGANTVSPSGYAGGGGGSSYFDGNNGTATATGVQSGNGLVVISY